MAIWNLRGSGGHRPPRQEDQRFYFYRVLAGCQTVNRVWRSWKFLRSGLWRRGSLFRRPRRISGRRRHRRPELCRLHRCGSM